MSFWDKLKGLAGGQDTGEAARTMRAQAVVDAQVEAFRAGDAARAAALLHELRVIAQRPEATEEQRTQLVLGLFNAHLNATQLRDGQGARALLNELRGVIGGVAATDAQRDRYASALLNGIIAAVNASDAARGPHRAGEGAAEGAARARADPPDCGRGAEASGIPQVEIGPTAGVGETSVGADQHIARVRPDDHVGVTVTVDVARSRDVAAKPTSLALGARQRGGCCCRCAVGAAKIGPMPLPLRRFPRPRRR